MQQVRRALGQSSIYALFQGFVLLGSLISFPIITRILSIGEYGALSLVNTTATLLVALAKCGIATAFLRYHAKIAAETHADRVVLCATAFWTACIVALAVAAVYGFTIGAWPTSGALTRSLLIIVVPIVVAYAARDLYYAFLRSEEKVLRVSYTTLGLRLGGIAGGLGLAMLWEQKVLGFFVGVLAVEGSAVLLLWLAYARRGLLQPTAVSSRIAKDLLIYGAPLIVFEFSSLANDHVHRYLLAQYLGLDSVGIYSVGFNLATYVQALIVAPVWLALFPIYSRMWEADGREVTQGFLSNVLRIYSAVTVGIFVVVLLNGHELVQLLASEKFAPAGDIFIFICGALLLYGSTHLLGAGFHLMKRTGTLAAITAAAAVANVALNFVLIPRFGIMGAVYATVGSYLALTLAISLSARSLVSVTIPWNGLWRHGAAAVIAGSVASFVAPSSLVMHIGMRTAVAATVYVGCLYWLDAPTRGGLQRAARKGRDWVTRRA